ncbi:MAG: dTMP kinase [Eubacterium sp.]|nr:dTMP kinase [Eubacterium sp.]
MRGTFIVMEGPDGSGKSTQIELLKEYLDQKGQEYIVTREPGGTVIGEAIRGIILNPEYNEMSDVTEMLLYAASRAQLMKEVIVPAIESGKVVISDRFVDSSMVYQGIARGLGAETVSAVNAPGIGNYRPDRVFFIDIPEEEGLRRKKEQKKLDRLEQESIDFHHMVSKGYRKVLARRPDVVQIDGTLPIDEIQRIIREEMQSIMY